MSAYYNDNEIFVCQWIRNLIDAGLVTPGFVDERSIADVQPEEFEEYTRAHFFAGIAGWDLALQLAGWPQGLEVWTGSCPCQPFSAAGKRKGTKDERHLWPEWWRLIAAHTPRFVFGEQVASPDGRDWLAAVRADLEALGYAVGAADICAAGIGAPHIRQRLYFGAVRVADAMPAGRPQGRAESGDRQVARGSRAGGLGNSSRARSGRNAGTIPGSQTQGSGKGGKSRNLVDEPESTIPTCGLANVKGECCKLQRSGRKENARQTRAPRINSPSSGLADAKRIRRERGENTSRPVGEKTTKRRKGASDIECRCNLSRPNPPNIYWRDPDWLFCQDEKWRPVEPGSFPLSTGIPGRVGKLRAYGNTIVPSLAAVFIQAFMETINDQA